MPTRSGPSGLRSRSRIRSVRRPWPLSRPECRRGDPAAARRSDQSRGGSAQRDDQSLRGLPGTFARTTLNGVGFADPILSSATNTASTPLGAFNSDIFSAITVIKSPDASDLAGGLSGNIDLRIAPWPCPAKRGGYIKASYEYNDLGGLGSPQFSGGYNAHITDNFAVFGVLAYKVEKFRRDSISVNTWANRLGSIQVGNQALPGSQPDL